ncbi:N-carbamoyl-L-amino-acid hydrolase [Evansella vedderi]|uniref:N-carbamoyl-L-amino-acid hydrolase n=1 Tax=Evansella vedderi TaxID=38282 RepID=A0ABT9ZR72_9BACI|nr:M20 family metallo-hydrolase [Evansella vedderi]MDQ0252953.1 N-carbamoyl-L-amino-acid hydrolase [Evansella vedderi]
MEKTRLSVNLERLKKYIDASANIGTIPGNGVSRLALSKEDKEMRLIFEDWMKEAGLKVRVDDFGNMIGRREGKENKSPVVLGSHLDTQPNGGRYDGILGVLSALEVVNSLNDSNIETLRPIEIVNFTNEEGARFEPPMLGSGGTSECLDKQYVYNQKDTEGRRFEEELEEIGYKGIPANRIKNIFSFIELHIEQGPILESEGKSIGAVNGIQGMAWLEVKVTGESDHAGTTPINHRRDALVATSKMIVGIEEIGRKTNAKTTVGRLTMRPNVANCIPEEVIFSVDIRHDSNTKKVESIRMITELLNKLAVEQNVSINIEPLWDIDATIFNPYLVDLIKNTAEELEYEVMDIISGAGHDAKYINSIGPTAMIFVPSVNGKSHHESELTHDKDIEKGANTLLNTVYQLSMMENEII